MTSTSGCTDLPSREVRINWEIHRLLDEEELIGTMLHEMNHVKLFQHRKDADSLNHTQVFLDEVDRINAMGPYRADVYHDLPRQVVEQLRPYVWRCTKCGYVLRLPNSRTPGPLNLHLVERQEVCDKPQWVRFEE